MKKYILLILLMCVSQAFGLELVRQRNAATVITFPLLDSNGDHLSSVAALDSEIDEWSDSADNPDGFADCTNEATEIGSTGIYYLVLTAGEVNHQYVIVRINGTNAKTQTMEIRTTISHPENTATTDDGGAINVTGGDIDGVVLVATTTTNTDMVGTDGANTTVPDASGTAASLHSTTDTLITNRTLLAADYFLFGSDTVGTVQVVNALGAGSIVTASFDGAAITDAVVADDVKVDVVTAESTDYTDYIETRTLAAAAYFLFGADEVASVATVSGNVTGSVGEVLTMNSAAVDEIWAKNLGTLTAGQPPSSPTALQASIYLYYEMFFAKHEQTAILDTVFNHTDTPIYDRVIGNAAGTTTKAQVGTVP